MLKLTNISRTFNPGTEDAKLALDHHQIDMMFFMLTNILTESTSLVCVGNGAEQLIESAFRSESSVGFEVKDGIIELPGVVSRKKQLIPLIMMSFGMGD